MLSNDLVIKKKLAALNDLTSMPAEAIAAGIRKVFPSMTEIVLLDKPWSPGGGSILLNARLGSEPVFIKVKDKSVGVESRLEHEQAYPTSSALQNEAMFCQIFAGDVRIPVLKAYREDDTYGYEVFERLVPFDQKLASLDAYELYCAYRDIEAIARRFYEQGLVHTDIHEKNVLFRDKQAVLCDFEEARMLAQDLPFEESLDVCGTSPFGSVGNFPEGYGLSGPTCLNRLRELFRQLIKNALPALLDKCHFSNDCPFNADTLQDKDERIYQSIDLGGTQYAGQRPLEDSRIGILGRLLNHLEHSLGKGLCVVDIGSNLGNLSFAAAKCDGISRVVGLEAFPEYSQVSQILNFFREEGKVEFHVHRAGDEPLPVDTVDILLLFSVYHHIRDKDAFLRDLSSRRPRAIIAEMAVQDRYYEQRGKLESELKHIGETLRYKTVQIIGWTADYRRPICLFHDGQPLSTEAIESIMTGQVATSGATASDLIMESGGQTAITENYAVKVSVVLPTYNHAQYLPEALSSILKQTFEDFELIVVDDGSTDNTANVLSAIKHPKLRVITQNNRGLPVALNRGFAESLGAYRTWTSADNVVGPTWLEQLVKALDAAPPQVGFVSSAFALVDERGTLISVRRNSALDLDGLIAKNPGIASFLYRSDVAKQVGEYDESLMGAEDWDMWIRILEVSDAKCLEDVLYFYRLHGNSMTSSIPDKVARASADALERLEARHGGSFDLDRIYPRLRDAPNAAHARWQAKVRLGTTMMASPFCQPARTVQMLVDALRERYQLEVHLNLVHFLCRVGAWDLAIQSLESARGVIPASLFDQAVGQARLHDVRIFQTCPIYQIPDEELAFKLGHANV